MMARQFGISAKVILSSSAAEIKKNIIQSYGAEVIESGETKADWIKTLQEVERLTGAIPIPNDNHWDVIIG